MSDIELISAINAGYEERRTAARAAKTERVREVHERYPEIQSVDLKIYELGKENLKKIMRSPDKADEYNAELKEQYKNLYSLRTRLLEKYGIEPDFDKEKYECALCSDTGYTPDGRRCRCFRQRMINSIYARANLPEILQKENFSTFSFKYYSDKKHNGEMSERENMKRIYDRAKKLCDNFDNVSKGLVFYGGPGLGKTFLSNCIAKDLMDKGKIVLYVRASRLFNLYDDYKFGRNPDRSIIDNAYDADLLIIDDLGTEAQTKISISFLDDLINERTAAHKKTVISTNLNMKELAGVYSRRFTSRLFENFLINRFEGEDIRMQKL